MIRVGAEVGRAAEVGGKLFRSEEATVSGMKARECGSCGVEESLRFFPESEV